ncbi:MAG: hypothetical protein AAGE86_15845 [Pseudomonadota bacterium]
MSMDFLEKNKTVLSFAAVTVFGAMVFAATTGTGVQAPEEPVPVAQALEGPPSPAPSPAPTTTSFDEMFGEYEADQGVRTDTPGEEMSVGPEGFAAGSVGDRGFASDTSSSPPSNSGFSQPRQSQAASTPSPARTTSAVRSDGSRAPNDLRSRVRVGSQRPEGIR